MAIEKDLKMQSIVILAQSFNTTAFNHHWLVKNNFVEESDIMPDSIFAPDFSQVITQKFNMLIVPQQLQFNAGLSSTNFNNEIQETLLPIINRLQEIPYKALGINLNWLIKDSHKDMQTLSKELFSVQQSNLYQYFDSEDTRYGAYISKTFKNSRLRLDIKPVNMSNDSTQEIVSEYILCNFNFHINLKPDNSVQDLTDTINQWDTFKNESEKIINLL